MRICEVKSTKEARQFINLPISLYKEEKNWIRPLDKDIINVFDPKTNKNFKNGKCIRWLLLNDKSEVIGKIAAFVNEKTATKDNDQPTGGVGFFDCINDQNAANLLFDTAKKWLEDNGMEAMDGPINFGNRDAWWGLLVEGFNIQPNYQCNYNFPYYQELFENYGFQMYFKQFTFGKKANEPLKERLYKKAELVAKDPDYSFRYIDKKNLSKYAEDFRTVYNDAWAKHGGVPEMSSEQAATIMKKMKPIMDEKIIWFAYHKENPVAFYVNLPDLNQIFKHVNGKLDLIGKLKFLYHTKMKTNRKMVGVVFGISPEHQGKGVDGGIIKAISDYVRFKYPRYDHLEMNWIGDFNRKMVIVAQQVGGSVSAVKTHHTYRYLFDRNKPFERMKFIK